MKLNEDNNMPNESKTQILELFGTLEWAKVFEHNRDRAAWNEEKEGEYKVTIILDEENTEKFKASGCGKALVAVDGGNKVTFARPHKGKFEWQGGAPKVANIKGQPWDFETDGYIGNGSTGLVNVSLFNANGRTGSRLEAVQVVDHVEFESDGNSGPSSTFRDLSNLTTKTDIKPKKAAPVAVEDDAIPF
jgi:hypothetical protein